MSRTESLLDSAGRPAGLLLLGLLGTAGCGLAVLWLLKPLPAWLFYILSPVLGPFLATKVGTVGGYTAGLLIALVVPVLLSARVTARPLWATLVGKYLAAQLLVIGLSAVAMVLYVPKVVGLLLLLDVVLLGMVVVQWGRTDERADAMAAVIGGSVGLFVGLFFAMFVGLGWNAYTITATEVPAPEFEDNGVSFESAPAIRENLFENCETNGSRRRCSLGLRGIDRGRAGAGFLARHGVRCGYETGSSDSFVAEHNGSFYQVRCETRAV